MMVELNFTDIPPGVNNLYVNRRGGGRFLSERGKAWRELAGYELNKQKPPHIPGAVALDIAIADSGRSDLDGHAKILIDLLVGYGVLEDDNRKIVRAINLYWSAEVQGCRVRIGPISGAKDVC